MASELLYRDSSPDNDRSSTEPESPIEALSPSLEAFLSGLDASRSPSPIAIALDPEEIPSSNHPSSPPAWTPQKKELLESDEVDTQTPSLFLEDRPPPSRTQKHPATFQCSLCPKRFTRAYNLRSHLRTHTDERPFVCSVCGKAFARQHDRKRHEGLHPAEKKFVCGGTLKSGEEWGCGRRFARRDALQRHLRTEAASECLKGKLAENGEIGETWSGELSKKDARHMSYTISEDYTNKDRVRRKRLYAFKRCYSRKGWKDSARSSTVQSPPNQGDEELEVSIGIGWSPVSPSSQPTLLVPPSPKPFPPIVDSTKSISYQTREIKNKIMSIGRLSRVFQVLREESENVTDLSTMSSVSRQTRRSGTTSPEDASKTEMLSRRKMHKLNSSQSLFEDSSPEIPADRSSDADEPALPATQSPDVVIGNTLKLNNEDRQKPPYYLSKLVGRTSEPLRPPELSLERQQTAKEVGPISLVSEGAAPDVLSKWDRAPAASYGLRSLAL